jgi:hypothetical protein
MSEQEKPTNDEQKETPEEVTEEEGEEEEGGLFNGGTFYLFIFLIVFDMIACKYDPLAFPSCFPALNLLEQLKGLSVEDMRCRPALFTTLLGRVAFISPKNRFTRTMLKAPPQPEKVLSEPTLDAVAEAIREGKCMHSNAPNAQHRMHSRLRYCSH